MIKTILIASLCLYLAACDETSSPSALNAPNAPNTPVETPQPWTAPETAAAIEQEIRGTYYNSANRNSTITVNSDFSISGSIVTVNTWIMGQIDTKYDVCKFTGNQIRAIKLPGNPYFFLYMNILTGENYGNDMPRDCPSILPQGPIDSPTYIEIRGFPSEKCVDLNFATSTGIQHYCKD